MFYSYVVLHAQTNLFDLSLKWKWFFFFWNKSTANFVFLPFIIIIYSESLYSRFHTTPSKLITYIDNILLCKRWKIIRNKAIDWNDVHVGNALNAFYQWLSPKNTAAWNVIQSYAKISNKIPTIRWQQMLDMGQHLLSQRNCLGNHHWRHIRLMKWYILYWRVPFECPERWEWRQHAAGDGRIYSNAAAPEIISISSRVMTACRVRLNVNVSLSIISPAFFDALSMAVIRDDCSEQALSFIV